MSAGKKELFSFIDSLQQLVSSRTRNEVTKTYFNSLNESKSDMVNRLMQCVWNAEYALLKRMCKESPATDDCLRTTTLKFEKRHTLTVKDRQPAQLTEADFAFMQDNLTDARAMLEQPEVSLQLPHNLQNEPIVVFLLAIDPQKFLLALPDIIGKNRISDILKSSQSIDKKYVKLMDSFVAFQSASSRPSTDSVENALAALQSNELVSLFKRIAHDEYQSLDVLLSRGGGVAAAIRPFRMVWSRFVVWIFVIVVDLLDLVNISIHAIVFKPLTDCANVLKDTMRPDSKKQSNVLFALSSKIRDATSQALTKFGYHASVYLLAAEPQYAERVFHASHTPFNLNKLMFAPGMRQKYRRRCQRCLLVPLDKHLLPHERGQYKTCTQASVFVAGEISSSSYVVIYSHHRGTELGFNSNEYTFLSDRLEMPLVAYDYCGYGDSGGEATESGCYQSVLAVCNWVCTTYKIPLSQIFSLGFSMGSAMSAYLAFKKPDIAGVVLVSPFTSLTEILNIDVPGLNMFRTKNFIHKISCPILLIHGRADRLIPFNHSRNLYWLARRNNRFANVQIYIVDDMDHVFATDAEDLVRNFLRTQSSGSPQTQ